MGVYKLSTAGGLATPRTNYSSFLAGNPAVQFTSYESIATVTVGSGGSATVSFTSIPATYAHLQIRGIARTTAVNNNTNIETQFNSDTSANYTQHELYGAGTSAVAFGAANTTNIIGAVGSPQSATSGIFGAFVIDILDYADTNKYMHVASESGIANSGRVVNRETGAIEHAYTDPAAQKAWMQKLMGGTTPMPQPTPTAPTAPAGTQGSPYTSAEQLTNAQAQPGWKGSWITGRDGRPVQIQPMPQPAPQRRQVINTPFNLGMRASMGAGSGQVLAQ